MTITALFACSTAVIAQDDLEGLPAGSPVAVVSTLSIPVIGDFTPPASWPLDIRLPDGCTIEYFEIFGQELEVAFSPAIIKVVNEGLLFELFSQIKWAFAEVESVKSIRLTADGNLLSSYLPKSTFKSEPPPEPGAGSATKGLGGKNITIGPSHGRYYNGSAWYWQRSDPCGLGEAVLEDTNSIRLMQFLYQYLAQDGATVHVPRELNESNCCNGSTGLPWWKMAARYWLQANGLPSSVWDSSTTDLNDDIRARPLFADHRGSNIYIAHHTNAGGGGTATGTETFRDTAMQYPAHETNSYNLAVAVQNNVIDAIRNMYVSSWASRGVKDANGGFGEIRVPNRPAILIELAFHDGCNGGSKDAQYLTDNFFRSVSQWGIYKGVCQYFGVGATWDKYSCEAVSNNIPATMTIGQTYPVTITYRNRGVLWSSGRSFKLGAVGDSDPFASTRHNVSGEIRPGSNCSFSFTMTPPSTPGTYTTDWRMIREGVAWFGPTVSKSVQVISSLPIITTHPSNATACPGTSASFTVAATGTGLTYQWQKNSSNIANGGHYSGATTATLTISNIDSADAASYRCVVTSAGGSVNSNSATLTVQAATTISQHPQATARCAGESATFSVVAAGQGTLSYQWQKNAANITDGGHYSGATTATLTVSNIDAADAAGYRCVVTAGCGAVTSNSAALTLTTATAITQQPQSTTVCPQTEVAFTVTAGGAALSYQWQIDTGGGFTDLAGADAQTLNITAMPDMDGYQYRCVVGGTCGTVVSEAAVLSLKIVTAITAQPQNQTLCPEGVANFSVAAQGAALGYQWQVDVGEGFSDIAGAVQPEYATLAVTPADDGRQYRCVVAGDCGTVISESALLTVQAVTTVTQQPQPAAQCPGESAVFTVEAIGEGTLSYRWQKDETDLSDDGRIVGADSNSLLINNLSAVDAGEYRCVVTGGCGPIASDAAALMVKIVTAITDEPISTSACMTDRASFAVQAIGTALQYQWQLVVQGGEFADIPGANGAIYETPFLQAVDDGNQYRCVVTGDCGMQISAVAALTVIVTPAPADYSAIDLGTLGGSESRAYGINSAGEIVGWSYLPGDSGRRAFVYRSGRMIELPTLGGNDAMAFDINDSGKIVGKSTNAAGQYRGFIYADGTITDTETLDGDESVAYAINAAGQTVGSAQNDEGNWRAFLYTGGGMADRGTLGGTQSSAQNINGFASVVGWSYLPGDTIRHAFLYRFGSMTDLGTLDGNESIAYAINSSNQIVGTSQDYDGNWRAFMYSGSNMGDLGTLGGAQSAALDVTTNGQSVGWSEITVGSTATRAFWRKLGVNYDLNTLVPACPHWEMQCAQAINDDGQIVGWGKIRGQVHGFVFAPVLAPDFDRDGDADLADITHLRGCMSGPGIAPAAGCVNADLDGDSDVDLADFGILQKCISGPNAPIAQRCLTW